MKKKDLDRIRTEKGVGIDIISSKEQERLFPEPKNRFVAFLDILGFKNMVYRNSPASVYSSYIEILRTPPNVMFTEECRIHLYVFSDSILIYSEDESVESANQVLAYVDFIVYEALHSEILLKGAIAHGIFTADNVNRIYFGQPLIDAFELQEELKVASVILHHTAELKITDASLIETYLREMSTPMRSCKVLHTHVVGFDFFRVNSEAYKQFYLKSSGKDREYIENTRIMFGSK